MSERARPYIGGQAVLEGVLMRASSVMSVAVRRPNGSIAVKEARLRGAFATGRFAKWPGVRGVLTLVESLSLGYGALRFSAEQQLSDEERAGADLGGSSAVISMVFALGLFVLLPQGLTSGLARVLGVRWDLTSPVFHLVTGGFKLLVFTLYLALISRFEEVRRVFQYHGAEHKTIFAYEAGLPLTVANVRAQSRLHPRCGTTFLVVVIAVSIVLGATVTPLLLPHAEGASGFVLTFLLRVALLPVIAAVSYELQRLSARYCTTGPLRMLLLPGFLFQRITTREPDDAQLEVAISAMEVARVRDGAAPAHDALATSSASAADRVHVFGDFASLSAAVGRGLSPTPAE
jgi:uncharacterized protein YqhQ